MHPPLTLLLQISLIASMLEHNGLTVLLSTKSEIKLTAVHAGHSELLNQWLIDGVLQVINRITQESQWKISLPAVLIVVTDVTEDILLWHGNIGYKTESAQETLIKIINGANHTSYQAAEPTAHLKSMHLHVYKHVSHNILDLSLILKTSLKEKVHTMLQQTLLPFKPKLWPMDQSKLHSQFMKTSLTIKTEFMFTLPEHKLEDMPLKSLDGVLVMDNHTGSAQTLGLHLGVWTDSSGS